MNNLSVCSLSCLLLLFLDKRDEFANRNEEFYNPSIKEILATTNDLHHQLFAAGLQARERHLPRVKEIFLQRELQCDMGRVFNDKM